MLNINDYIGKIVCADCMDILKQLPDKSVDLILTDPPYKQEYHTSTGTEKTIKRENYAKIGAYGSNSNLDFTELFYLMFKKLKQVNMFVFCDKETKFDFMVLAKKNEFCFREIPFLKTSPTPFTNNQWLPDIEWGLHIYDELPVMGDYTTKRGYFVMPNFKEQGIEHPTPKRVDVVGKILQNISNENDLVLDCFSGSGTTAVACHRLKRRFICIEKDKNYWEASCKRLEEEQKQYQLF